MIGINKKKGITLAIETAIGGGSLALLESESILDRWIGETGTSRSEELIGAVSEMLGRNQLNPSDISLIAVSRGPGSYTGARIGIATAIGISNGLNIECVGASILDSLYHKFGIQNMFVITAVSFGKSEICFQVFEKFYTQSEEVMYIQEKATQITTLEMFVQNFGKKSETLFVFDHKLYLTVENLKLLKTSKLINAGLNIADFIGQFVIKYRSNETITPIYPRIF